MKRTSLARRTPLRRAGRIMRRARRRHEPGAAEFKALSWGRCCVCGQEGILRRHHVMTERHCRELRADPWALENSLWIGTQDTCRCHRAHHDALRRIPARAVPDAAVCFLCDVLGSRAGAYLSRYYAC